MFEITINITTTIITAYIFIGIVVGFALVRAGDATPAFIIIILSIIFWPLFIPVVVLIGH